MFPLRERKLIRGALAHVAAGLGIGADYVAKNTELYAPFDGIIETYYGVQGGNWLRLKRENGDHIEMAHLSKYIIKSGAVTAGRLVAITGNTGAVTTGPHLHIQILNKGKRLDPEKYNWGTMTETKVTLYRNKLINPLVVEQGLVQFNNKISTATGGEFKVKTEILETDANFDLYQQGSQFGIIPEQILNLDSRGAKVTCLVHNKEGATNPYHHPLTKNGSTPIQIPENWYTTYPSVFSEYYLHELLHAWYYIIGNIQPYEKQLEKVHNPPPNWGGYGNPTDYYLSLLLELKPHWGKLSVETKGEPMVYFQIKGKSAVYELVHEAWRGYDDPVSFAKDTSGKEIKLIQIDEAEFKKLPELHPI